MSRRKILVAVVLSMVGVCVGAQASAAEIQVNFTGLLLLEAKDVSDQKEARTVEVLLPDGRYHANHPHFAQIRFACNAEGERCGPIFDLVGTEVKIVSNGSGQNGPVKLAPSYEDLIGFNDDLEYGATKADPTLAAKVILQGGTLAGHEDRTCKYAFAAVDATPAEADYKLRSYLAVLTQSITDDLHIELKDGATGKTTRIPIDPTKPWLFFQGKVQSTVTVWIVNDPPPWNVHKDLRHYTSLGTWLGEEAPLLVPHRYSSCPKVPASGTSFCPPATQP